MSSTRSKNQISDEKVSMDKIIEYIDKKFENLKKDIFIKIESQTTETTKSIEFISAQYDELLKKMDVANKLNQVIQTDFENIKKDLSEKNNIIKKLEIRLADIETISKGNNLEIAGIPQQNREQPAEIIRQVAAAAGITIKHTDITNVIRVPDRRNGAPPKLLVTFSEKRQRDSLLEKKKDINYEEIKNLTTSQIYIGEELSPYHKEILWKAKQIAKEKNYQFVWFKHGKVMLRKEQQAKIKYIRHIDDLVRII